MISLALRFENHQRMMEWVDGMTSCRQIPPFADVREEDALDKFEERYILVSGNAAFDATHREPTAQDAPGSIPVWPSPEAKEALRRMRTPRKNK